MSTSCDFTPCRNERCPILELHAEHSGARPPRTPARADAARQAELARARRTRYARRKRAENPDADRANRRRQDLQQRLRLIRFLDGECCRCGLRDHRGLVVVQPAGQRMTLHQLYTLMLNDPDLAQAELRLLCATCRQIEVFEASRASSASIQRSDSDRDPSSVFGAGARSDTWGRADGDSVAFG